MSKKKVVLAYSGGLDTACILKVLIQRGYEVLAYVADVGQHEDFDEVGDRARRTGASRVVVDNLKREVVTDFIFPAIAGNAVYENRYLLGTALARPVIARGQVELALAEGARAVAHGATGEGERPGPLRARLRRARSRPRGDRAVEGASVPGEVSRAARPLGLRP